MRLPGHIPPSTSRSPSSSATHHALPRRSASFPRLLRGANYRVHVAAPNSPGSSLQEPFLVDRRSQPPPSSPTPSSNGGTQGTTQCVATGDSVMCEMLEQEEEQLLLSERTLSGSAASTAPPSLATTVMNTALLVSPFFFWGTSMPALKLVMPHVPSPLLLGALRLLPASLLLIAWAAVTGRKHPNTWQAWGWILLFSIVDGAAFQVGVITTPVYRNAPVRRQLASTFPTLPLRRSVAPCCMAPSLLLTTPRSYPPHTSVRTGLPGAGPDPHLCRPGFRYH